MFGDGGEPTLSVMHGKFEVVVFEEDSGGIEFVDVLLEAFLDRIVGFTDVEVFGIAVDLDNVELPEFVV